MRVAVYLIRHLNFLSGQLSEAIDDGDALAINRIQRDIAAVFADLSKAQP